ncbi:acylphosphatase [Oleidesulfovibrio sp.]|uniref:acylphosphatase n=1 Tax=Oleidesulfovibrio sp. TaxID=2909707 RepID=UPI003A83EE14
MKSLHCVVTGNVDSGSFLAWVHDQAAALSLTGWVRKLETGKVEVLAQGDEEGANKLRTLLKQGSALSGILEMKADWIDYEKSYDRFEMR